MSVSVAVVPPPLHLYSKKFVHNNERQEFFNLLVRARRIVKPNDETSDILHCIESLRVFGSAQFEHVPRIEVKLAGGMFKYLYEDQALEIFHEEVTRLLDEIGAAAYYAAGLKCPQALLSRFAVEQGRPTLIALIQDLNESLTEDDINEMLP